MERDLKKIENLCRAGCCPSMHTENGTVYIIDDFKSTIKLTPDQMDVLVEKWLEKRNK